ncbi:hypothetical protein BGZ54_006840, partial [Gamsiella multidivaricata]
MLTSAFSSSRSTLSPQKALDLANIYLGNAQKAADPDLTLILCADAGAALSWMKRADRRALIPPMSVEDQTLCNGISTVYSDQGKLLGSLGYRDKAQASFRKAEKWRYLQDPDGNPVPSRPGKTLIPILCAPKLRSTSPATPDPSYPETKAKSSRSDIAQVPPGIFSENAPRPVIKHDLPGTDGRIASTPQLAYCLELLSKATSSTPCVTKSDEALDRVQCDWIQARSEDADEKDRLRSLVTGLIAAFIDDDLKNAATVAEVVYLVPVLDEVRYRKLLSNFIDGIGQATLLDFNLLEGLAQLIQSASPGYLPADDLVKILGVLSTRLQDTHSQSSEHRYQLALAVSRVLDAMADSDVKGLNREQLHAPLSAYLEGMKDSSDPYLVYQAAYAYQVLQYVPDDETPLQAVMRRTRVVVNGISGLVSAVKGLDVSGFIDGLGNLQEGLGEVYQVAVLGYEGVSSLVESGQGFLDSLKEGLSFSRKRAWYPALRGADALLRDGRLAEFKSLICEAPCRRDPAFEWGLCQRLGEIAADPLWEVSTHRGAVNFLGELYRNDLDWGQQANVKQWILTILIQLGDIPDSPIKGHARTLLQELEKNGDPQKQALYHTCINGPPNQYPLKVGLPPLASPSLLDRVQDIPDVEDDLRRLKERRLAERGKVVYIPPRAKASLQASDDVLFPLMENVKEFLSSDRRVLLLLGDSGAGKSTFNRELECELWSSCGKQKGRIPLHI